jgi:hypothetical protein
MVNGFREMDARSPTHELYLTQNQKSTIISLTQLL